MFAEVAPRYDRLNRILSFGMDGRWRRALAAAVREAGARRVLDLAAGTGDVTLELERALPGAHIVAADFCLPLLRLARTKGVARCVGADALALPFGDAQLDAVCVAFGVRNFPDRRAAFREAWRVLRPGGLFAMLEFSQPSPWLSPAYHALLGLAAPLIAAASGSRASAYRYLADSVRQFPDAVTLLHELALAGFQEADVRRFAAGAVALHVVNRPAE